MKNGGCLADGDGEWIGLDVREMEVGRGRRKVYGERERSRV